MFAAHPGQASAEGFTSGDFLKWSHANQSFYFRTSIGMAGLISAQNNKQHAKCIEDWYFTDEKRAEELIFKAMRKHPGYHPRGIIIAVLQKACGPFKYTSH